MHIQRFRSVLLLILTGALLALPASAESQVRIVRLSDVQGLVQINKNAGLGFENAFVNLPITQGTQLRTRDNGRAEIEFEDGSTLRLTPDTTVVFSTLGLSDAGKRVSVVDLTEGKAYVYWIGKSSDELTVNFAGEKVVVTQPAHFRVISSSSKAELASFKKDIEVVGPSGTVKVSESKMVTFDVRDADQPSVAERLREDPYDEWDEQAIAYHDQYAKNNSSPYGYGSSDLAYYGNYSNVPGYGMMWQPFFAGFGWDPFMDGAWAWYPGMGFLWASAYPWGWLPYNYGNWAFVPGFGWGWQPNGWKPTPPGLHYIGADAAHFHAPVAPTGTVSTVVVGRGGPVLGSPSQRILVSSGTAGLGVPRGSYGSLKHVNSQVAKTGSAELHAVPQFAASAGHAGFLGGEHSSGFGVHSGGSAGHAGGGSGAGGGHGGR